MSDRTPDPTPCPEREESLALHAGGDLPSEPARELERHLARCPGCRTFLSELGESLRLLEDLAAEPPASELAAVHRRVIEQVRRETSPPAWRKTLRWAAAASVLLLLGGALLWQLGRGPDLGTPGDPETLAQRTEQPGPEAIPTAPERPEIEPPVREAVPEIAREAPRKIPETARPPVRSERPRPQNLSEPETQRAGLEPRPDLKIQLVSDDPGIVIYWLVETEKPHDATPTT